VAHDPDEFLRDRCHEVPFVAGATYHFVAATADPPLVGRLIGDRLVRPHSASGRDDRRRLPFEPEYGLTITGLHHFDLLNHPLIHRKLSEWIARSPAQGCR
jgi:hypothetical protein